MPRKSAALATPSPIVSPAIPIQPSAKRGPGIKLVLDDLILFDGEIASWAEHRLLLELARARRVELLETDALCARSGVQLDRHGDHADLKGYEFRPDEYALVTKEELDEQKPESSKSIEVELFVETGSIDPIYFETSHYLTPGDGGQRGFILLRDVLIKTGKVAIAKAVLSGNTEHTVLIRPYNAGLALHTMFYQEELKSLPMPVDQIGVSSEEMKLATKLVENMTGAFDPLAYSDSYAANVKALVKAKLAGTAPKAPARKERKVETDLLTALTASVNLPKKRVA